MRTTFKQCYPSVVDIDGIMNAAEFVPLTFFVVEVKVGSHRGVIVSRRHSGLLLNFKRIASESCLAEFKRGRKRDARVR